MQLDLKDKTRDMYRVEWLSDCEYYLYFKNSLEPMKFKITKADENGYECYGSYNNRGKFYKVYTVKVKTEGRKE